MIEDATIGQGSAHKLEGDVYVLNFFVGTPDAPADAALARSCLDDLAKAEAWLERQAARFGKRLHFTGASYGMNGELTLPRESIPDDPGIPNAWFFPETVYRKQGFRDGWDVSEYINWELSDCAQWISIVHCNIRGRSFACPASQELISCNEKKFFLESCVVFRYDSWPPYRPTTAATYAHEILHLFGASDLYARNPAEKKDEARFRRRYPDSIMLGSRESLQESTVDEVTAWLVGWGKRPIIQR